MNNIPVVLNVYVIQSLMQEKNKTTGRISDNSSNIALIQWMAIIEVTMLLPRTGKLQGLRGEKHLLWSIHPCRWWSSAAPGAIHVGLHKHKCFRRQTLGHSS